jgi:type I restriction enzyme S subunit
LERSNRKKLGDLAEIRHGFAFPGKYIVSQETDRILMTPGHFALGGGFRHNHKKYFDSSDYRDGYELESGDLVVTMTDLSKTGDTLGFSAVVPEIKGKILLHNQRIGKVVLKSPELDKNFCHYLLRSKRYRQHVLETCTGSTVKHTSPTKILDYEFDLLLISEQKAIAHILGTLDDKIELNQKMNQTLEEIAKAIFKSWFVDFDPVRAKADGRPTGFPPEISDLFPDELVDSEIGEIPRGWESSRISEIANKVSEKYKKDEDWSEAKLIDLSRMPSKSIALNAHGKGGELSTSVCKFKKYDFLFGSIRPYFYKAGICPFDGVSNTSVFILRSIEDFDREFLYFYSSSDRVFEQSIQYSDGTKMPIIKWKDFQDFSFALPDKKLRQHFSEVTRPIVEKLICNIAEEKVLSELRDTLLPKLISGELCIPDAEKFLEEAGI